MKPIPVVFHLGPLQIHTYGIGLAITFWFAYRYFLARLHKHGYPTEWFAVTFAWIVVAAIVGARALHVIANLGYYSHNLGDIVAVWHGGLSSFGGLALAIPVGIVSARKRCPQLPTLVACDLVSVILVAAWSLGRLLGPQLMIAGGGKPTTSWLGMYYAGEVGKRLPVPIFQSLECLAIYLVALYLERNLARRHSPSGVLTATVVGLWVLSRFFDEYFWLTRDNGSTAIEVGSLVVFGLCLAIVVVVLGRSTRAQKITRRDQAQLSTDSPA